MMYIALANLDRHIPNVFKQVISRIGFNERLISTGNRSHATIIPALNGNEIFGLIIVFSSFFMTVPLEMVIFTLVNVYVALPVFTRIAGTS